MNSPVSALPFFRRCAFALALLVLALPGIVQGQETPGPDQEQLTAYAKAFTAVVEVRERWHEELARTHDDEGSERVRLEFDEAVEVVLEEHGFSSEEYEEITFLVSTDEEYRSAFTEALARVREGLPR